MQAKRMKLVASYSTAANPSGVEEPATSARPTSPSPPNAPPPPPTALTASSPPPAGACSTPENRPDIVLQKQGVSGPKATKKAQPVNEYLASIQEKVFQLEKNVTRRLDRLQGTVAYMSRCVEDFNDNFASIMDVVRDNRVREVSTTINNDFFFPLTSTALVNSYIEHDSKMVKAIDRYRYKLAMYIYIDISFANPLLRFDLLPIQKSAKKHDV